MFITKQSLSRRTFLRGAGVTLSLPLLDAMVPAFSTDLTAATPVTRYGFLMIPHGVINEQWIPDAAGRDFEFKRIMKPLEPFRNQLTSVGNVDLGYHPPGAGHTSPAPMWLSGGTFKATDGADIQVASTTIDQLIAQKIGKETTFPSLELTAANLTSVVGACETGFSCTYLNTIAWSSPTTPLPMESNPRAVFERMFGDPGTREQRLRRLRGDKSILDSILGAEGRLRRQLNAGDSVRLDEYLQNLREIERRIQAQEKQAASSLAIPSSPAGVPDDYEDHVNTMFDLMAIAYQTDITRVITFMIEREMSNRAYPQVGADEAHHGLSHHGGDATKIEKFARANIYHVTLFARFLEKLRQTPDGDGSLLDHSLFMFGSGMGIGNIHAKKPLPIVLVGGAGGRHRGNKHLVSRSGQDDLPLGDVLLSVLDTADIQLDRLGYGTGRVDL